MDLRILFVVCSCLLQAIFAQFNYKEGFDKKLKGWTCAGKCKTKSQTAIVYSGKKALRVFKRNADWKGLTRTVAFKSGQTYKMSAYVQIENMEGELYQYMELQATCTKNAGGSVTINWGITPKMVSGIWYELGGVQTMPADIKKCKITILSAANVNYFVDELSVSQVDTSSPWIDDAIARIELHRKADIQISLEGTGIDNRVLDVEVKQRKHEFAFGTRVTANKFIAGTSNNDAYQNVFYDNFEWGVIENSLQWRAMQPLEASSSADGSLKHAMSEMNMNGIRQRCHSVFSAQEEQQATWVKELNTADLLTAIQTRMENVANITEEMCEHWDVNNEYLNGDFFERNATKMSITNDMFKTMHAEDPGALMYFNENMAVNDPGIHTTALKDIAEKMWTDSVPVGGLGLQGHFTDFNPYAVLARLDLLDQTGLPITITEFEVIDANDTTQAMKTRDLLTLFYSHPSVTGVIFNGFWDGSMQSPHAAMFSGPFVMPNEAGKVYQDLFHNTWKTRDYRSLLGSDEYYLRGFLGEYQLVVSYQGDVLADELFTLDKCGRNFTIHVDGGAGTYPTISKIERDYARSDDSVSK